MLWPPWHSIIAFLCASITPSVIGIATAAAGHHESLRRGSTGRSWASAALRHNNASASAAVARRRQEAASASAAVEDLQQGRTSSTCEPDFDVSTKGVKECKGTVCGTRRYIDVDPTDPEDYNDMHMELGGRACVPKECASDGELEAVAKLMWKQESQMSRRDFGSQGRRVSVSLDIDCSGEGGAAVHCDRRGDTTSVAKVLESRHGGAPDSEAVRSRAAASHKPGAGAATSFLLAAAAAAWGLLTQLP